MAASISQMNPLCVKFFIFFSETFLALRLSGGSVLPPNSWSLPCGSIPLKDDDEVDVESLNKFFNMAMCEEIETIVVMRYRQRTKIKISMRGWKKK
jgi:hypothetical protein